MKTEQNCINCIHYKVCGLKKDYTDYDKFIYNQVEKIENNTNFNFDLHIKCNNFMEIPDTPSFKGFNQFIGTYPETICNNYAECNELVQKEKTIEDTICDDSEPQIETNKERFTRLYRKYVKEHNTKFDGNNRYYAYWNEVTEVVDIDCDTGIICAFQIYGSSKEVIENAIKFIGEDNFKKYILEIKE